MANRKPLDACTVTNVLYCKEEKQVIREFQREYEEKHNESISMADATCEIVILYKQLKEKK